MLHVTIRSSFTRLHEIDYATHIHAFQTYAEFLRSREGLAQVSGQESIASSWLKQILHA